MPGTLTSAVPQLLTEQQVSEVTGIAVPSLRADRCRGNGFPFVKFGKRVRYRADDLVKFIAAHTVPPGSPAPQRE